MAMERYEKSLLVLREEKLNCLSPSKRLNLAPKFKFVDTKTCITMFPY